MNIYLTIATYAAVFIIGYLVGYSRKKHKVDAKLLDYQEFLDNQVRKQAKVIEDIRENLEYFTVGQLYELSDYFKENDFEESEVLLGIFSPEKTDILL